MKKMKRLLTLTLALIMVLSVSNLALAANFWDTRNHWANSYINWAADVTKLVDGYPDGSFQPEGKITKAEFYKMINRLAGFKEKATINFSDVGTSDWFYDEVAIGVKAGYLTNDYSAHYPNTPITRDEAARIVAHSYLLTGSIYSVNMFTDANNVVNKSAVGALVDAKILNGYPDGSFRPGNNITRGEFAKVLYTAVNNLGMPEIYKINTGKVPTPTPTPTEPNKAEWDALKTAVKDGNYYLGRQSYYRATQAEIDELKAATNAGQAMIDGYGMGYGNIISRRYYGFSEFWDLNKGAFVDEAAARNYWNSYSYYGNDGYHYLKDNAPSNTGSGYNPNYSRYSKDDIVKATTRIRNAIKNYTDDSIGYNDSYTISFNSMGGTSVASQTIRYGNRVTAPYAPTRSSYRFDGWYTDTNYRYSYDFNTLVYSNVTLYAKWVYEEPSNTYSVNFNSNGGSSVSTQYVRYGERVSEPYSPTRTNYRFDGWYTDSNLRYVYNFSNGVYSNMTLYAKWTYVAPAPTNFTVRFNANGGTSVTSQVIRSGGYAYAPTTTRTGYSFVSWLDEDGRVFDFSRTPINRDRSLTAQWTYSAVSVRFDLNGGSGSIATQNINYGGRAIKPADPTRTGYTINGWSLDGWSYNFSNSVTKDITLRANWTINNVTVNFDSNGGNSVASRTVPYNSVVSRPSNPTRTGYVFDDWYVGSVRFNFNNPVTSNITLTAKWNIYSYTVTVNPDNGSAAYTRSVSHGGNVGSLTTPVKEGFDFKGWTVNGQPYNLSTAVTANITIVAKWEAKNFTVTFNSDGGSAIASQTVSYNQAVGIPADPTKEGHVFGGWTLDNALYDFTKPVTSNTTLTAKWTPISYTVTFDVDGGSPTVGSQTVEYGKTALEPTAPTKANYTFSGWYLGETKYEFTTVVKGDVALKAKWALGPYVVTPPTVTPKAEDGSVTVTPVASAFDINKLVVTFKTGETGTATDNTVTATKSGSTWTITGTAPDGVTINASTGAITITDTAVKDGSSVSATVTDVNSKTATGNGTAPTMEIPKANVSEVTQDNGKFVVVTAGTGSPEVVKFVIKFTDQTNVDYNVTVTKDVDGKWSNDGGLDAVQTPSGQANGYTFIAPNARKANSLINVTSYDALGRTSIANFTTTN